MTTYNTGNPLGSTDPKDLYDNAQNLDTALNSSDLTWTDRLGNLRPTFQGAVSDAITATELADGTGASRIGYTPAGAGAVATTQEEYNKRIVYAQDYMTAEQKMNVFLRLGTVDVTTAIRKAIDYVGGLGGGTVRLPAGVYRVFPQIVGEDCISIDYDNVALEGEGQGKTIIDCFTVGGQLPTVAGTFFRGSGILIKGLAVGRRVNVTLKGFTLRGNANANIGLATNITNGTGTGWDVTHKGIFLQNDRNIQYTRVVDVEVTAFLGELLYGGGSGHRNTIADRCVLNLTNGSALSMGSVTFTNGRVFNACSNAVECAAKDGREVIITDSIFEGDTDGFSTPSTANGVTVFSVDKDSSLTVSNNVIKNMSRWAISCAGGGLYNAKITNNTIINCSRKSQGGSNAIIQIAPGTVYGGDGRINGSIVAGNSIYMKDAANTPFYVAGAIDSLNIQDNRVFVDSAIITSMKNSFPFFTIDWNLSTNNVKIERNTINAARFEAVDNRAATTNTLSRPLFIDNLVQDFGAFDPAGSNRMYDITLTGDNQEVVPGGQYMLIKTNTGGWNVSFATYNTNTQDGQRLLVINNGAQPFTLPIAAWNWFSAPITLASLKRCEIRRVGGRYMAEFVQP